MQTNRPTLSVSRLSLRLLIATAVSLAYGASVAPMVGEGSAWRLFASVTAGWILSLALLGPLSQTAWSDVVRHGTAIMVIGVLPLIPLTVANFLAPSPEANVSVLMCDALLMLGFMIARIRRVWISVVWFAVLEATGLAFWVML